MSYSCLATAREDDLSIQFSVSVLDSKFMSLGLGEWSLDLGLGVGHGGWSFNLGLDR